MYRIALVISKTVEFGGREMAQRRLWPAAKNRRP
jgi:hypothetical protein